MENNKMPVFLIAFFASIFAHIFGGKREEGEGEGGNLPLPAPKTVHYSMASWTPYLKKLLPKNIPMLFATNYMEEESGGNPCKVGRKGVKGPDGYPLEQGIAQIYNPDDFKVMGIKSGELRKYCDPSGSERCIRPLTTQEMTQQVKTLIDKINLSINYANRTLIVNSASSLPGWGTQTESYWALVKMVHGLPGLVSGMAFVTKKLSRPPSCFAELRTEIIDNKVKLDSGTEKYRTEYVRIFDNAEKAASGVAKPIS